jgi:hypothetical protein
MGLASYTERLANSVLRRSSRHQIQFLNIASVRRMGKVTASYLADRNTRLTNEVNHPYVISSICDIIHM